MQLIEKAFILSGERNRCLCDFEHCTKSFFFYFIKYLKRTIKDKPISIYCFWESSIKLNPKKIIVEFKTFIQRTCVDFKDNIKAIESKYKMWNKKKNYFVSRVMFFSKVLSFLRIMCIIKYTIKC